MSSASPVDLALLAKTSKAALANLLTKVLECEKVLKTPSMIRHRDDCTCGQDTLDAPCWVPLSNKAFYLRGRYCRLETYRAHAEGFRKIAHIPAFHCHDAAQMMYNRVIAGCAIPYQPPVNSWSLEEPVFLL
jgi:hypothetical protein